MLCNFILRPKLKSDCGQFSFLQFLWYFVVQRDQPFPSLSILAKLCKSCPQIGQKIENMPKMLPDFSYCFDCLWRTQVGVRGGKVQTFIAMWSWLFDIQEICVDWKSIGGDENWLRNILNPSLSHSTSLLQIFHCKPLSWDRPPYHLVLEVNAPIPFFLFVRGVTNSLTISSGRVKKDQSKSWSVRGGGRGTPPFCKLFSVRFLKKNPPIRT